MSGPKTSRYTLTPDQRRILAEQREIERRKAVATENIKRTQKRLLQLGRMFGTDKQIAAELTARTGSDNNITALIDELESFTTLLQPIVAQTDFDDVNSVEKTAAEVRVCLAKAERLADKITAVSVTNEASLKSNLQEAFDQGFGTSFADIKEVEKNQYSSLRDDTIQKLAQLQKAAILPCVYKDEIAEVYSRLGSITDEVFFKNFISVTVNPLIKKAKQFIEDYAECQTEFEKLYVEYTALCELYHYIPQEYICSHASIQALKAEIQRIKNVVAEDDEKAYINECLDEVMTEMGYSVLGSREVTKRNGKHFRNELYTYDEGTAVSITYSPDGKIAMELGGIDTSDRVPTIQETEKLCDSMEQFCEDFKEIEKRLLTKGVILDDRISLLPPDAEYAQIINTTDYSMKREAESIDVKKQRRLGTKQKAMRRE